MSEKRFGFFDGGNVLRRIDDTMFSRFNDTLPTVQPAGHHKKRNHQIELHIDTQDFPYTGAYEAPNMSEKTDFILPNGAELATHLLGAGWLLNAVVYHVKRAGAGTLTPFVELYEPNGDTVETKKYAVVDSAGAPLRVALDKPGFYLGYVPAQAATTRATTGAKGKAAGQTAAVTTVTVEVPSQQITVSDLKDSEGNAVTGTVTVPAQEIDVEVPLGAAATGDGYALPAPVLSKGNGYLLNTFTAAENADKEDLEFDACVGIYVDITEFYDEHACNCAPKPCETTFPDPECMPLN